MIPYVTTAFNKDEGGLRTEDVSRMSYQLFSAVDHCAKHGVIHRDIKPREFYYFFAYELLVCQLLIWLFVYHVDSALIKKMLCSVTTNVIASYVLLTMVVEHLMT